MEEINREIGLDALLRATGDDGAVRPETPDEKEKKEIIHHEETKEIKNL